jgi:Domain of unknown function (DUF5122) beta-propeller
MSAVGALDSTSGLTGTLVAPADVIAYATGVGVQADGRIVAAGFAYIPPGAYRALFALARYNTDGSLDLSFGNEGRVVTRLGVTALGHGVAN